MPEKNVQIVRELAESFQRREHEKAFEFYDPEIEWDARDTPAQTAEGVYHGHEGVRAYWRDWLAAWRDLRFEIEDVRGSGDLVVLLIRNQRQWGRLSGIETRAPRFAMLFSFRDGRVIRVRAFLQPEAALEAAGLAE